MGVWMPYTTPTVFSAIRFTAPPMAPGSFSVAKLTTSTTGMVDGMKFQNYLNAALNTVGANVPQTQPVNTAVWDTKASGVVYWDENENGAYNSGEKPIANVTVEVKCTTQNFTATTNAQGVYTVEHVKNGDTCGARVINAAPANSKTSGPTTYTTPAFTVDNKEINNLNFGFTPLLGDATFTYFFSLDGSACTEASSNCYPVSDLTFTFNT